MPPPKSALFLSGALSPRERSDIFQPPCISMGLRNENGSNCKVTSNWKTTQNAPDAGAFSLPPALNTRPRTIPGQGSHWAWCCPGGHLATSGEISACHTWGRKMPLAPSGWRTGTLLNIHDTQGSPMTKNYPVRNASNAESEKLSPTRWQSNETEEPRSLNDYMELSCPSAWTSWTVIWKKHTCLLSGPLHFWVSSNRLLALFPAH